MKKRFFLNIEEKSLINLFFFDEKIDEKTIKEIDLENLIKISSSNLLLPLLYSKIKSKNYQNYFPEDFIKYIREIYLINENRNKILIKEIELLEKELKNSNINYILLKGSYYIKNKIYSKIGERMIGDIDILIKEQKLNRMSHVLMNMGYRTRLKYKFWKTKHTPRYINREKIFAIEPHIEPLIYRFRRLLTCNHLFNSSKENVKINQIKICVYNFLINDYGNLYASFNLRTAYDLKKILNNSELDIELLNDKLIKRFLILTNFYGISNYKINLNLTDKVFLNRHLLKRKSKLYFYFDNYICIIIESIPKIVMQTIEFIFNKDYRNYAIEKILKNISKKK